MTKTEKFWAFLAFSAIFSLMANMAFSFYTDDIILKMAEKAEKQCQTASLKKTN